MAPPLSLLRLCFLSLSLSLFLFAESSFVSPQSLLLLPSSLLVELWKREREDFFSFSFSLLCFPVWWWWWLSFCLCLYFRESWSAAVHTLSVSQSVKCAELCCAAVHFTRVEGTFFEEERTSVSLPLPPSTQQ